MGEGAWRAAFFAGPMKIIQLVPALAPTVSGVGDYARLLARQLCQDFGIDTHFVVGSPLHDGPSQVESFAVTQVTQRTMQSLVEALAKFDIPTVLLHYVGYGYAKRGVPIWLAQGLARWRESDRRHRLVTMFHELDASGPPWSSSFWLSPLQRYLVRQIADTSHLILTNTELYATRIQMIGTRRHADITTIPVFSNIGEPANCLPLSQRSGRLLLFGHPGVRAAIYETYLNALRMSCELFGIDEICEIGPPADAAFTQLDGVTITRKGVLSALTISALLQDSRVGFLAFPAPSHLAKSTIFAAYCTHGVMAVHVAGDAAMDGLVGGKHYWVASTDEDTVSLTQAQTIADAAHAWYQPHRLSEQAKIFASALQAMNDRDTNVFPRLGGRP